MDGRVIGRLGYSAAMERVTRRIRGALSRCHASRVGRLLWPKIHARSGVSVDSRGSVTWEHAPDLPVHGRSTIKLLTCLTARPWVDLDHTVTITGHDVSPNSDLVRGDVTSVRSLFHAVLMRSDSTAALALVRVAGTAMLDGEPGDPRARFLEAEIHEANRIGMGELVITDPRGFGRTNRVSARGMVILLRHIAAEDPWLYQVSGQRGFTITVTGERQEAIPIEHLTASRLAEFVAAKGGTDGHEPTGDAYLVWAWRHPDGTIHTSAVMSSDARNRYLDAAAVLKAVARHT